MKKKTLLILVSCLAVIITLTSSSSGPAHTDNLNRSAIGCGGTGCHDANHSNNTIVALALIDKATGMTVSNFKYSPGRVYQIKLLGGNNNFSKFGFQLTCVQKVAQSLQAGAFANYQSTVWDKYISGIQVIEQSTILASTAAGVDSVMMEWTAPNAGAGTVRFYYMLNAVNGDGSAYADQWNGSFTDFDADATAVKDASCNVINAVYPVPVDDLLHISLKETGVYTVCILNAAGRMLRMQRIKSASATLSVNDLAAGNYYLIVSGQNAQQATSFIKK